MTMITRLTTRTILGVGSLLLTYAEPSSSQEIDGDWRGAIDVMDQTLPFVVHFATTDSILSAVIDIQGVTGLALQNVSYEAPTVHFELPGGPGLAVWDGEVVGDSVTGTFTQAGVRGTFTMARFSLEGSSAVFRAPASYDARESRRSVRRFRARAQARFVVAGPGTAPLVAAQSDAREELRVTAPDGVSLAGTLHLPRGPGPHPVVVFVHGSEPGVRTDAGYIWLALTFQLRGVAVLVFDKRGVGDSDGEYVEGPDLTVPAGDVAAWVELLAGREDIRSDAIGLLGWSQGGWVGPLAASIAPQVDFIVSISGSGVSPLEQNVYSRTNQFRATGAPAERVEQFSRVIRLVWTFIATGRDSAAAQTAWDAVAELPWFANAYQGPPMMDRATLLQQPQMTHFVAHQTYDPVPVLESLDIPFLAVFGADDQVVPVEQSLEVMRGAFARSGNRAFRSIVFPHANHGIQIPVHGRDRGAHAPGYPDLVVDWVLQRVAGGPTDLD